jgi:hypothetical protein
MFKKLLYIAGGLIIVIALFCLLVPKTVPVATNPISVDYKAVTYTISGKPVVLESTPGVAYFGNEVSTDLNNDGRIDIAFLITQKVGDSIFYYVVAGINTPAGYIGSQAVLIADRIAPQTTETRAGLNGAHLIVVNYADRKAGEAFTVKPSIGKSLVLKFDPKDLSFGEVVQNFEGESNVGL